ncbi:MAG: hypothetical protein JHC98_03035 [Thermoleophilaceae bacterium]|nr:hypothetical protein [Thermoleophilaceae bacterium]
MDILLSAVLSGVTSMSRKVHRDENSQVQGSENPLGPEFRALSGVLRTLPAIFLG